MIADVVVDEVYVEARRIRADGVVIALKRFQFLFSSGSALISEICGLVSVRPKHCHHSLV